MFLMVQIIAVFLVSVAMALALAHALELPGKMRLSKEHYLATQTIYYPGFTIGGGVGEGLGMVATLLLLVLTPTNSTAFWWTLTGFVGVIAMHAVFWLVTQPTNKFWVSSLELTGVSERFFGPMGPSSLRSEDDENLWKSLRKRWEYSHVLRAIFSTISLIALIVAVAIFGKS